MKLMIDQLKNYKGKEIELQAFVDNIRNLQYVEFIILRDSSGKVQMTIEKEGNENLVEIMDQIPIESTVKIIGKVMDAPKVKLGGLEIIPTFIEATSLSFPELPFDYKKKDNSLRETRLDYRFLDLRRKENYLLFQCETLIEQAMREYCIQNNFIEIHSPKISGAGAESGAELFKLDYFGQTAYLSQSPQFYKQMAMASGFNAVYEIGPAFRAENSHTSYHATEINMADMEISWIHSFEEVMDVEEAWLKYILNRLKDTYGEEIKENFGVEISNTEKDFPRITFQEAKQILKEKFHYIGEKTDDLERHEEELLCKYAKDNYQCDFIFITKFPFSARPFYHHLDENGLTDSYDLLYKGVEITTGAQREHRYDVLYQQILDKNLDPEKLSFYLEFFKYGCPPHGGFGFGIARLMMQIFEIDNIREATFIYRGPTRLNP